MSAGVGVDLQDMWIKFGDYVAVRDANVNIAGGEFFSFLGGSGCGKTTILRAVSGFLEPAEGKVLIGGQDMAGKGPNERPTALIFQNLALFPLMKVWENITFSMEVRGASKAERQKRADELLDMIALPDQRDKYPSELSGGQKQRVAIARALCAQPDVLLLDEPLSALYLKLRQHMRTELREIQQRVGITFIYITHDQGEALTMSDSVAVMRTAVIDQIADGRSIYDDPATSFVASFVGENNMFGGKVKSIADGQVIIETNRTGTLRARLSGTCKTPLKVGDKAMMFIRPETFKIADQKDDASDTQITAHVRHSEFEGQSYNVFLESYRLLEDADGKEIKMALTNRGEARLYEPGTEMTLQYEAAQAVALPAGAVATE